MVDKRRDFFETQDSVFSTHAKIEKYIHDLEEKLETSYKLRDFLFGKSTPTEITRLANTLENINLLEEEFKSIVGSSYIRKKDRPEPSL